MVFAAQHTLRAQALTEPDGLAVKALAQVETRDVQQGRAELRLMPAERVVPGDPVIYTLEVRNPGPAPVHRAVVTYAVPEHTRYVADSAAGPSASVTFSVDGGHDFAPLSRLTVAGPDGRTRAAVAADVTHIRWQLRATLKVNSLAYLRFRAVVK